MASTSGLITVYFKPEREEPPESIQPSEGGGRGLSLVFEFAGHGNAREIPAFREARASLKYKLTGYRLPKRVQGSNYEVVLFYDGVGKILSVSRSRQQIPEVLELGSIFRHTIPQSRASEKTLTKPYNNLGLSCLE